MFEVGFACGESARDRDRQTDRDGDGDGERVGGLGW